MRYLSSLFLALVVLAGVMVAQGTEQNRRAPIGALVERRLQLQQSLDLSADSITFDGKLLHLRGTFGSCGSPTPSSESRRSRSTTRKWS